MDADYYDYKVCGRTGAGAGPCNIVLHKRPSIASEWNELSAKSFRPEVPLPPPSLQSLL